VVPERFSWFAAILPPIWALAHGLWLEFVVWALLVLLLGAAAPTIGGEAAFWAYVVVAAWIGFEAPALRRAALRRRGWRYRGEVVARDADLAMLEGLNARRVG
jgi:hypothetical protein